MQPADDIKKLIDESQITSSAQVDRRILADALADLEKRRVAGATNRPGAWRILMNSKWSKSAAAAVIAIAVLIALPFLSPFSSKVTFAQAIQPILNANSAIFDVVVGVEDPNTPVMHDMVIGSRIRRTLSNVPGNVSIIDLQAGRILTLEESKKEAAYINLEGLPSIPNYLDVLKNLLTKLPDNPRMVVEDLGMVEMEGRKVVGFLARHPNLEVTVWADAKTGLPVRIEHREKQLLVIVKNMQFDVPMEESLFSMDVPAGYELQQEVELDLFGATEADFIEGLRILAEIFGDGQFPDGVALDDYLKRAAEMERKTKELGLSLEEEIALGTKLQKYILFLRFFRGEGRWYYRGQGVQLGEAETPIFWYRPKGSETYRVIYGDLHVEDVAVEDLPEPLDADDVAPAAPGYGTWSKPDFVGTQVDLWQIRAGGQIVVQSDIMLMKGPDGVSTMPITLPYSTAVLRSASVSDSAIPFQEVGAGQYEVEVPLAKLLAGQTRVACTWALPLTDLEKAMYGHRIVLQSLIPVVSYELKVALEADSGLEFTEPLASTKHPSGLWAVLFTWAGELPKTTFGSCGLTVRKSD